ncbi:MAG: hypothetical protein IPO54_05990 [Micavibrio sp.]|nr:hypothetical protein [Micavibrio sp.]
MIDRGRMVAYGPKDEAIRKLQARQYGTAAERIRRLMMAAERRKRRSPG